MLRQRGTRLEELVWVAPDRHHPIGDGICS
jgi:hypothetical protein